MSGPLIAKIVLGTVFVVELPDNSGLASLVLGTRYRERAGLWLVATLAITGGRGLLRILPMRWISRLAALVMVVMAVITLAEAFG